MAVDEALLDCLRPDSPPVLRTYRWDRPTLSLGRAQPCPDRWEPGRLHADGIFLVRRPTGGRAVLHDAEWTYALVAPSDDPAFPKGIVPTYGAIAEGLLGALRRLGIEGRSLPSAERAPEPAELPDSCFRLQNHHEISVAGGGKLIGSAQRRRGAGFLQHGSLLFGVDRARWSEVFGASESGGWSSVGELLGRLPPDAEVEEALTVGFAEVFGVKFEHDALSAAEGRRAAELYSWKYASLDWTVRGVRGERERRWGPGWQA